MNVSDEVLTAYVDGELDAATRSELEAAIAANVALAQRVARHRALIARVRGAFDPVLREPVPDRLLAAVGARAPAPAKVTDINVKREARTARERRPWSWPQLGAIAASLAAGAVIGQLLMQRPGPLQARDGNLIARGELAAALSDQLVSEQARDAPIAIGISFRAKAGDYCRTFRMRARDDLAGLACRDGVDWRVDLLTRIDASVTGGMEQAGTAMPEAVLRTVDATMAGEPMDGAAEKDARQRSWHD
ncbi:MAG TPA: hypothetical protein VE046_14575 [Steroidobacteraceae bacterium]|nr:hypothetical protein [Steroidobacteraceae bacterium]